MLIGAHMSKGKGFSEAFSAAKSIGASTLQLFAKSPMRAALREITDEEALTVRENPERKEISFASIHASYLLNFAKKISPSDYQFKSLAEDLRSADKIGAHGVVVHLGKALELEAAVAETYYAENIARIIDATAETRALVILENTAGQGSEMGYRFPEWARVFEKIRSLTDNPKRVGLCLDTAHAFAGGYDMSSSAGVEATLTAFGTEFDWKHLTLVHLNDSKKPLGSRVDRHQDLLSGTMGLGLKSFVKNIQTHAGDNLPFILETPEEHTSFADQIRTAKKW